MKKAIVLIFFTSFLFGFSANEFAVNFGADEQIYENFIDDFGNANIKKISDDLKQKNKLNLILPKTENITLEFKSNGKGILLLKLIQILTDNMNLNFENLSFENSKNSSYKIILKTAKIPDPGEIYTIFKKNSVKINSVQKENLDFIYDIDISKINFFLEAFGTEYKKPTKPYFFNIFDYKKVKISTQDGDFWHPQITIFDKNLEILEIINVDEIKNQIEIEFNKNSKYIQVKDLKSLEKISKGLIFKFEE